MSNIFKELNEERERTDARIIQLECELADALRCKDTAEELLFDSRKKVAELEARLNLINRT